MYKVLLPVCALIFISCKQTHIGSIERLDPSLDAIISAGVEPEVIADGFKWTEGPLWIEEKKMLLFSDVFSNNVYQWKEGHQAAVYLRSSGYTGSTARGGELGSNGLMLTKDGKLVLCQHGNRQVASMNAVLEKPTASYTTIAGGFNGKRFNSPNDGTFSKEGELFFTDPPYGLEGRMADTKKEIFFQGVYKVKRTGEVKLLCDSITRPNGIALFPDEKKLLVANSDSSKPYWYSFDIENDSLSNGRIFYNGLTDLKEGKGLPDGLKIDRNGNVFAAGPGGIYIFNSNAKLLGRIRLPVAAANCAFSGDQKTLYITATNYLLRVNLRK